MAMRDYLATEVALDRADGLVSRREALRRLGLLGLSAAAASSLLAACSSGAAPAPSAPPPASPAPSPQAGYDVAAALARTTPVTFSAGPAALTGAMASAANPKGAVLVVHENRGLTDHLRAVTGRLAGDGYAALTPDLLSRSGETAAVADPTAALAAAPEADLVADLGAGLAELGRRHPGLPQAVIGFCFGGGLVWRLLQAGAPSLAAAVPFYGPAPQNPAFPGVRAAVLGIFAERDARVDAGIAPLDRALTGAGVVHEMVTIPGADHAFFNDTGPRFVPAAAADAYRRTLSWFDRYLR